ncbi:MAG TPA: XrtA/PEP-CTERM system histidine kinase PrsK [Gammaproteobacteria bacterium]|nr:XrtA/PEP-CTERM system histidine kinase PrsK [Gammaproteobacteria bacterium]
MTEVAVISHGMGAAAFFAIVLVLLFHPPTRQNSPWIILGCFFTAIWSTLATLYVEQFITNYQWIALAEVFQDGSWCFALTKMLTSNEPDLRAPLLRKNFLKGLLLTGLSLMLVNALLIHQQWLPGIKETSFVHFDFIGHLLLSILGLSLVEQLMRGIKPERLWGMKFFCLGIGTLFCYDFILYSHSLLFKNMDSTLWGVRGALNLFVAPMIVLSTRRTIKWHLDIVPSRLLVYRSTAIIVCGIYLFTVGLIGYFLRELSGNWGKALQVLFIIASALFLFLLVFSGSARAWIKMFLARNVFKLYYDYREEWLRFNNLLSTPKQDTPLGARIIIAFANMVESPEGVLFERQGNSFRIKNTWNVNLEGSFTDAKFNKFLDSLREPLLMENFQSLVQNYALEFPSQLGNYHRAWLFLPLHINNQCEAFIIIGQPRVTLKLNWEICDLLKTAASCAAIFLYEQKLEEALHIAKQFEGYHRVSAFMLHDIKNVISSIQLILQNRKFANDVKFIDSLFITLENIHLKLSNLRKQLYNPNYESITPPFNIVSMLLDIVKEYQQLKKPVQFNPASFSKIVVMGNSEKLKDCIKHVIDNGLDACRNQTPVELVLHEMKAEVVLAIIDKGQGMDTHFLQTKLFKPFVSTKGTRGMGIGVYQTKTYLESIGGKIFVESAEGKGTTFKLIIPKSADKVKEKLLEKSYE